MDWKICLKDLKNTNKNAISVFVGAGMSVSSGLPQWDGLAKPYKQKMKIKDSTDIPYERIFQYAFGTSNAEYVRFKNGICDLNNNAKPQPVHRLIARMNFPRIWTTNYDGLLEKAYNDENMSYQLVAKDEDIYRLDYERNQIIKMHGSLTDDCITDIVLMESEYENYIQKRNAIYQLLQTEIRSKNIIYLGFSFNDINLRRIISAVWNQGTEGKLSYLFTVAPKKSVARVLYDRWKADLERYNLIVVELDNYSEINDFLLNMVEMHFGKNIVLLGKRDDDIWNSLTQKIGYKLASKGFKIHSGGGPNIADSLATGAWDYLEKQKIPIVDKVTFYYRYNGGSTNPRKGNVLYCGEDRQEVRRKMISTDKICLVIGSDGVGENGIQEEISIANSKRCKIIPVGCTGDTAKKVWDIEKYNYQNGGIYSEKEAAFNMLNSTTATEEDIVDSVIELADYLLGQKESM